MGHGQLQQACDGWKDKNCVGYHTYTSPVVNTFPDSTVVACGARLKVGNGKESLMGRIVHLDSVEDE